MQHHVLFYGTSSCVKYTVYDEHCFTPFKKSNVKSYLERTTDKSFYVLYTDSDITFWYFFIDVF